MLNMLLSNVKRTGHACRLLLWKPKSAKAPCGTCFHRGELTGGRSSLISSSSSLFLKKKGVGLRGINFTGNFEYSKTKWRKSPLLIILVSATGRQSHSLTLCSPDCIDRIVQFWFLTGGKKKLWDRGNNSCFGWGRFWYTENMEMAKRRRRKCD